VITLITRFRSRLLAPARTLFRHPQIRLCDRLRAPQSMYGPDLLLDAGSDNFGASSLGDHGILHARNLVQYCTP